MAAQKKYPDELRERAVRMVLEIRERDGRGPGRTAAGWAFPGVGQAASPGSRPPHQCTGAAKRAGRLPAGIVRPSSLTMSVVVRTESYSRAAVIALSPLRGAVLDAKPDGSCLAEFAFAPQTADTDGDFVQAVLTKGQYEIIRA
jgi:hypothetical protein